MDLSHENTRYSLIYVSGIFIKKNTFECNVNVFCAKVFICQKA